MSRLISKIKQRLTVSYCRLSLVENADGFLSQESVRSLLAAEGVTVVEGTPLELRVHYELQYKEHSDARYLYVCPRLQSLLPDMRQDAHAVVFSIADLFPLFQDKNLLRQQSFEVLDTLYNKVAARRVSLAEGKLMVAEINQALIAQRANSVEVLRAQLSMVEVDWHRPAKALAQVAQIMLRAVREGVYDDLQPVIHQLNASFQTWVDEHYFATLQSNHLLSPKSVNKVLPHIADNHSEEDKVALVVVDGFSFWQYAVLREHLKAAGLSCIENTTLTWLPSITMLSRQALFRGCEPQLDYKQSPDNERKLWAQYWRQKGFSINHIQYLCDRDEFAINEGVKRLAIVTTEMDEKMHSSTDYRDLLSLTENWCVRFMERLQTLLKMGYTLYITTDHGSVLASGWRSLTQVEKVFLYADGSRGARHLIYKPDHSAERDNLYHQASGDCQLLRHGDWLVMRDCSCFAQPYKRMITHGGCHFCEVVVPMAKITN